MKTEHLKAKVAQLQSKIGRCYDADNAPDLQTKWRKLKKHKIWIESREREAAESEFLRSLNIHEATIGIFGAICELLNAQGTSGLGAFAVTKDKMEWSIIIHQMGVRNLKTGRIDKRLSRKTSK